MNAYYNEFDPKAAAWLRKLVRAGAIPAGEVDTRDIREVQPSDLAGFCQCHFFAGIGGWAHALRLAGWPDDKPVWTGSCPCQPFSSAGKQKAQADERHLWPAFCRLIRECRPHTVFGEQVASAIGHGWLDGVCADLEAEGYACGAVVLGAHSVGAPHIRQRLYWVADVQQPGLEGHSGNGDDGNQPGRIGAQPAGHAAESGGAGGVGFPESLRDWSASDGSGHIPCENKRRECEFGGPMPSGWLGDTPDGGCGIDRDAAQPGRGRHVIGAEWSRFDLIPCRDGKSRRVESGTFPLADGVPARVVRLRGYGNAIVPQVAAEFIRSFCEVQ